MTTRARTGIAILLGLCALFGSAVACTSDDGEPDSSGEDGGTQARKDGGSSPGGKDAEAMGPLGDGGQQRDASVDASGSERDAAPSRDGGSGDASSPRSDASVADAAMDARSDAAASSGCPSGTLFCEDFEGVEPGELKNTARYDSMKSSGSTLTVEEARARGKRALHVHTLGNGRAQMRVLNFAPPNNSFFGRMHAYIEALPTAPNYAHYTLVEAAGMQPGVIRPIGGQYIAEQRNNLLGPGTDQGPTGDWTNWKPSAPFVAGKWVCFEWQLEAADNTIRVWIDGTAKPDLTVSTKIHPGGQGDFVFPTFNTIWFGWWLYQGSPTPDHYDLWLDDIALGSTRLGC